jgi:hypothetical protein
MVSKSNETERETSLLPISGQGLTQSDHMGNGLHGQRRGGGSLFGPCAKFKKGFANPDLLVGILKSKKVYLLHFLKLTLKLGEKL